MIALIIILAVVSIGGLVGLYYLGKSVRRKEDEFLKMFDKRNAENKLKKYKRKSTPKVPKIKTK